MSVLLGDHLWWMMLIGLAVLLFSGLPVAVVLAGVGLGFGLLGWAADLVRLSDFGMVYYRIYGTLKDSGDALWSGVPLLLFMGLVLQHCGVAQEMLRSLQFLLRRVPAGLAVAVILIGVILAPAAGMVGASVITLALIALPVMLDHGYRPSFAAGSVAAAGALGVALPPGVMLFFLSESMGVFSPYVFLSMVGPSVLLVVLYCGYCAAAGRFRPELAPRREIPSGVGATGGRVPDGRVPEPRAARRPGGRDPVVRHRGVGPDGGVGRHRRLRRARDRPAAGGAVAAAAAPGGRADGGSDGDGFLHLHGGLRLQPDLLAHRRHRGHHRFPGEPAAGQLRDARTDSGRAVPAGVYSRLDRARRRFVRDVQAGHRQPRFLRQRRSAHAGAGLDHHPDRDDPADVVSDPAVRLRPFLPARGGPEIRPHAGHLPRHHPLRGHAAGGHRDRRLLPTRWRRGFPVRCSARKPRAR